MLLLQSTIWETEVLFLNTRVPTEAFCPLEYLKLNNRLGPSETARRISRISESSMLRFGIVGISATIVYYAVAIIASKFGLVAAIANLVGFGAGALTSFVGHFHYTFKKSDNHFRYLIRFIIVTFFGYVLSNIIIFIALDVSQAPFWLAMLIVVLILPPASWLCNRYWAFNELA